MQAPIFAIVTPFNQDLTVDYEALRDYLAFLSDQDIKSIVANGTTGEFSSLSWTEKKDILSFCRENFNGHIVNHISSCSLTESIDFAGQTREFCDSMLVLPPFYYCGATPQGLSNFFKAILDALPDDLYIYNFPAHTGNPIPAEVITHLAKTHEQLRGLKDSSGDVNFAADIKSRTRDFNVYFGTDFNVRGLFDKGLDGTVCGSSNVIPDTVKRLYQAVHTGDPDNIAYYQDLLDRWSLFRQPLGMLDMPIIKTGLSYRIPGFPIHVRPPLQTYHQNNEIEKLLHTIVAETKK